MSKVRAYESRFHLKEIYLACDPTNVFSVGSVFENYFKIIWYNNKQQKNV